jgi:hypothetical protein
MPTFGDKIQMVFIRNITGEGVVIRTTFLDQDGSETGNMLEQVLHAGKALQVDGERTEVSIQGLGETFQSRPRATLEEGAARLAAVQIAEARVAARSNAVVAAAQTKTDTSLTCVTCGLPYKNIYSLSAHKKVHINQEKLTKALATAPISGPHVRTRVSKRAPIKYTPEFFDKLADEYISTYRNVSKSKRAFGHAFLSEKVGYSNTDHLRQFREALDKKGFAAKTKRGA